MKRSLIIFAAILTLLLCGCQVNKNTNAPVYDFQVNKNTNTSVYGDDISKEHKIIVVSSDTSEVIQTISGEKNLENFVLALNLDEWKLSTLPDNATEIGSFWLTKEDTIKFGETETDGTRHDVVSITLYNNSYICFEVDGLDMTFEVNEDTDDYLNGYFE